MSNNRAIIDGGIFYITAEATDSKSCDFDGNTPKCHGTLAEALDFVNDELTAEEEGSTYVFEVRAVKKLKVEVERKIVVNTQDIKP